MLLLIIVISGAVVQQSSSAEVAPKTDSLTECQGYIQSHIDISNDHAPLVDHATDSHSETTSASFTSCNTGLNILAAENDFSFDPGNGAINISFYNASISSQIFVFQDPDPPRLG